MQYEIISQQQKIELNFKTLMSIHARMLGDLEKWKAKALLKVPEPPLNKKGMPQLKELPKGQKMYYDIRAEMLMKINGCYSQIHYSVNKILEEIEGDYYQNELRIKDARIAELERKLECMERGIDFTLHSGVSHISEIIKSGGVPENIRQLYINRVMDKFA